MNTDDAASKGVRKQPHRGKEKHTPPPPYDIEGTDGTEENESENDNSEDDNSEGEFIENIDRLPSLAKLITDFFRKIFVALLPVRG